MSSQYDINALVAKRSVMDGDRPQFNGLDNRLAKIDLVTIFDCDYRWYCTIDYVIVNYIGIHHLFYHIQ